MSTTTQKICIEALSLPKRERADLAHRLLVSLEEGPITPEIEDAWKDTSEKRYQSLKKGATTGRDAKQALKDARRGMVR